MEPQLPESAAKSQVEQAPFAQSVLKHWQEFRPKMCAELEKSGHLYQAVWAAATRTADLLQELRFGSRKLQYDQAQEIAFREWYLLPDEREQPSLTFDPRSLEPSPEISD